MIRTLIFILFIISPIFTAENPEISYDSHDWYKTKNKKYDLPAFKSKSKHKQKKRVIEIDDDIDKINKQIKEAYKKSRYNPPPKKSLKNRFITVGTTIFGIFSWLLKLSLFKNSLAQQPYTGPQQPPTKFDPLKTENLLPIPTVGDKPQTKPDISTVKDEPKQLAEASLAPTEIKKDAQAVVPTMPQTVSPEPPQITTAAPQTSPAPTITKDESVKKDTPPVLAAAAAQITEAPEPTDLVATENPADFEYKLVGCIPGDSSNLVFSLDNTVLASNNKLWDVQNPHHPKFLHKFIDGRISQLAYNRNKNLLAIITEEELSLWNWDNPINPKLVQQVTIPPESEYPFKGLVFNKDGTLLAVKINSETIVMWDLHNIQKPNLISLAIPHDVITSHLTFNGNGKLLAHNSKNGCISIWDISNLEKPIYTSIFKADEESIDYLTFAPTHQHLVSISSDGTMDLWHLVDQENLNHICTIFNTVIGNFPFINFNNNGTLLSCTDRSKNVIINIQNPQEPTLLQIIDSAPSFYTTGKVNAFSMNGQLFACCDKGKVFLFKRTQKKRSSIKRTSQSATHIVECGNIVEMSSQTSEGIQSCAFKPIYKEKSIRGIDYYPLQVHIQEIEINQEIIEKIYDDTTGTIPFKDIGGLPKDAYSIYAFHPTKPLFMVYSETEKGFKIWNISNYDKPKCMHTVKVDGENRILPALFSPNGTFFATSSISGKINLWDMRNPTNPQYLINFRGNTTKPVPMAFSQDEKLLVCGNLDDKTGFINLLEISTPKKPRSICTIEGHTAPVVFVKFIPNKNILISAALDNTIKFWNLSNPKNPLHTIKFSCIEDCSLFQININPTGTLLAHGDKSGDIVVYDISNPKESTLLKTIPAHKNPILIIQFNYNGTMLVSSSEDKTLVWDVRNPERLNCINSLQMHNGSSAGIFPMFSGNGHLLAVNTGESIRFCKPTVLPN